jgi:hypothetical protein
MAILFFFPILYTDFHGGCTNLLSHQQCERVLFSPHPCQHSLFFIFLMKAILTGVKWKISLVALIRISLVAKDVESRSLSPAWAA